MHLRLSCRAATPLVLASCRLLEPHDLLTGRWGGQAALLDASINAVQLQFPCMRATMPPAPLDAAGRFDGAAQITWASFGVGRTVQLHVAGQVLGTTLTLAVSFTWPGYTSDPSHYTLQHAANADFSGYGCLATTEPPVPRIYPSGPQLRAPSNQRLKLASAHK